MEGRVWRHHHPANAPHGRLGDCRSQLESFEAKKMPTYHHSGFSVDASICLEAHDRAAQKRLLRYRARPAVAMERWRKEGAALM